MPYWRDELSAVQTSVGERSGSKLSKVVHPPAGNVFFTLHGKKYTWSAWIARRAACGELGRLPKMSVGKEYVFKPLFVLPITDNEGNALLGSDGRIRLGSS